MMWLRRSFVLAAFLAVSLATELAAQTTEPAASPAAGNTAEIPPIREYIHQSWDFLSRSMTDCKSLRDAKVTTAPILYLPAGMSVPDDVAKLHAACGVEVEHLPKAIHTLGDLRPESIKRPGLLYLPNRYVVPGGRFNEMYGWDSYFIILGLLSDGRTELARGMAENFFFEIENYGALLNANRTYFLTRSQPPLLASIIREVHQADVDSHRDPAQSRAWLQHAYTVAQQDYALWLSPIHRAGDTGLARYFDVGEGPVLEMADDSTYYPDAIRYMLAHKDSSGTYLVPASAGDAASCDQRLTAVCRGAEVDGYRLSRDFYRGDRAMRESGFDTSFRFGDFSGSTHHFAPVCLNSLLYRYEVDMAHLAHELGNEADHKLWVSRFERRRAAMDKYLWDEQRGGYFDYNFDTSKRSDYLYATEFNPLWAGLASPQHAGRMVKLLPRLEREHGIAMSENQSGMQWDLPYGWAPEHYFTIVGLRSAGYAADADRLAQKFRSDVETNYLREGNIREKYDVVTGSTTARVLVGYKTNAIGFGWSNGVYLRLLPDAPAAVKPAPIH